MKFTGSPVSNLMRILGMDDAQFAEFSGASRLTVQRWRLGFRSPSASDLARLLSAASERLGASVTVEQIGVADWRTRDRRSDRSKI